MPDGRLVFWYSFKKHFSSHIREVGAFFVDIYTPTHGKGHILCLIEYIFSIVIRLCIFLYSFLFALGFRRCPHYGIPKVTVLYIRSLFSFIIISYFHISLFTLWVHLSLLAFPISFSSFHNFFGKCSFFSFN